MHAPIPVPGTMVWIRRRRWRVESVRRDRSVVRLDVTDRERRLTFLTPFDRPSVIEASRRPRRANIQEFAARLAGLVARSPTARGVLAALDANVDILPYQLEPALAVASGVRRILVADEVGLGKTIQAALVIAELKRRRPGLRAMVIVPRSLRDQWRHELNERFGLAATVADRDGLETMTRTHGQRQNPWTAGASVWVVSADYLKQPHVFDAIPAAAWDVIVIDEAHDACGDSLRHEVTDEIARRGRHVLLLTATPHGGDDIRFQRLEALGRLPDLDDPLTTFRRTRASLGQPSTRRVRWSTVAITSAERAVLDALAAFEQAVLAATSERQRDGAVLLLSIFRKRALSTMSALHTSLERRLGWILGHGDDFAEWFQPRLDLEDPDENKADDDCAGLTADSGLPPTVERTWLRRLRALAVTALRHESKVRRVVRLLDRTSEPVVVFTEFRHSLEVIKEAIDRALPRRRNAAILHGGQSPSERAATITRFRRGEVSVLLATDVASQGLNLQERARWVISVELPWTPARIEQRIGRVDRIGQTRPVHATLILAGHPAENGLLERLAARALHVKRAIGGDALAAVTPPSERIVANALLEGSSLPGTSWIDAPPTIEPSDRWRRSARAVGRQLESKRALARRWRAPDDMGSRPCLATSRHFATADVRAVVVVLVPIVDGTGFLVERRLVCLGVHGTDVEHLIELNRSGLLREWLGRHLSARLTRLRRSAAILSGSATQVDRAIARHLANAGWPEEVQIGLFEKSSERAFDAAREEVAGVQRSARCRERNWRATEDVEIGSPSLELIFTWRAWWT